MGSAFSHQQRRTPSDQARDALPIQEPKRFPYYGNPVPAEASTSREDSETWYTDFFELAYCAPHRDGKNVIICWPTLPRGHIHDPRELEGWPVIKVRKVYERLGKDHPRIVRYVGGLEDGSVVVERLSPGPFNMMLPVMTIPVPQTPTRNDKLVLVLYYRWALQGLSALGFVHSRSVFLRTFSSQLVWLRSDYSLAITGFVGAEITGDDTDYGEGGLAGDESMAYDETAMHGSVKEDLFFWATFVWRLMTNDYTNQSRSASTHCWEPCCPMNGCDPSEENHHMIFSNRLNRNRFQELEEARLGSVLLKAWNSKYESADEVAEDIKAIASTMGIVVKGDEVEIDERWEAVLEVVEMGPVPHARSVRFKSSEVRR